MTAVIWNLKKKHHLNIQTVSFSSDLADKAEMLASTKKLDQ